MAVGGALRAAMKAGNWASAARESRRRARALAQLNARGGIRGDEGMRFARAGEETSERTVERLIDRGFQPDMYGWYAPGLRGNTASINPNTGTRTIFPPDPNWSMTPNFRNPIEAPYEGVWTWPDNNSTFAMPSPWMGRGRPPMGIYENVPRAFGGIADYNIPF